MQINSLAKSIPIFGICILAPIVVTASPPDLFDICKLLSAKAQKNGKMVDGTSQTPDLDAIVAASKELIGDEYKALQESLIVLKEAGTAEQQAIEAVQGSRDALEEAQLEAVFVNGIPIMIDMLLDEDVDFGELAKGLLQSALGIHQKQIAVLKSLNRWMVCRMAFISKRTDCIKICQDLLLGRLSSKQAFDMDRLVSVSRPVVDVDLDDYPHELLGIAGKQLNPRLDNVVVFVEYDCTVDDPTKNISQRSYTEKLRNEYEKKNNRDAKDTMITTFETIGSELEKRVLLWNQYLKMPKQEIYYLGNLANDDSARLELLPVIEVLNSVATIRVLLISDQATGADSREVLGDLRAIANLYTRWKMRAERLSDEKQKSVQIQHAQVMRALKMREQEAERFSAAVKSSENTMRAQKQDYIRKMNGG